jgi:hypothetical protein
MGLLKAQIAQAETLLANADKYIPTAVAYLEIELPKAKAVAAKSNVTEGEIVTANLNLLKAIGFMWEKGDKEALTYVVSVLSQYTEGGFTPLTWGPFKKALDEAGDVLKDEDAVKEEIEAAASNLLAAANGLTPSANFTGLNTSIEVAKAILDKKDDYVEDSLDGLTEALAAAEDVADNPNATQAQVDAAEAALNAKILQVRVPVDKSKLLAAYNAAVNTSQSSQRYTARSMSVLSAAMGEAKAVLDAAEGSATQEQADAAAKAVLDALNALELRQESGETGQQPSGGGNEQQQSPPAGSDSPATGTPAGTTSGDTSGNATDDKASTDKNATTDKSSDKKASSDKSAKSGTSATSGTSTGNATTGTSAGSGVTTAGDTDAATVSDPTLVAEGQTTDIAGAADSPEIASPYDSVIVAEAPSIIDASPAPTTSGDAANSQGATPSWVYIVIAAAAVLFLAGIWMILLARRRNREAR